MAKSKPENERITRLRDLDMSQRIGRDKYEEELLSLQHRLALVQQAYLFSGDAGVLVFEGWDAAGKGGTIRRISAALDPRSFKVWPIAAPRNYYLERQYFARFMERLPPDRAISVFDRSWYGRVLVERVEKLTPESRWRQAYREINEFERMLVDDGRRVVKLFFHITPEEQLRRFESRLMDPLKRWKLSYEDFRNRGKWEAYEEAIDEMLEKTSTDYAPWHVIPANQKKFARIAAMKKIVKALEKDVDLSPPHLDEAVLNAARDHLDMDDQIFNGLVRETRGRVE